MKRQAYIIVSLLFIVSCSMTEPVSTAAPNEQPDVIIIEPTSKPKDEANVPNMLISTEDVVAVESYDISHLWSYGLTSIRTGEPIIKEGGEHRLEMDVVSYGYNLVVDKNGKVIKPTGAPLQGGEQLILTDEYQDEHNLREYASIYTIMAPIRDTILYHFEETTRGEWLTLTDILENNKIKIESASEINGHSIFSSEQVYDYIADGQAEGSPVMRYLEEAELELKCLAFKEFDFTNPEGINHCEEQNIDIGSGIDI